MEISYIPKYSLVVDYIKSQICRGKYRVGEILPGQRILADILSLSRPSVKRAIDLLVQEGILECNPSIGSIVKALPVDRILIGYQVPELQDPFHLELIRELDILLHRYHGALIVLQGADDSRLHNMGISHAVKHHTLHIDGQPDRVKTVYTGDVKGKVNMVVSDVCSGMIQICDHLRGLGHRILGYASPFRELEDFQFQPLYETATKEKVLIPEEYRFLADPLDRASCERVIQCIMKANQPPTALVCYNDWLAIAIMEEAKRLGLDIPDQLSITGYDDLYVSSLLQTPLTTVQFSRKETAEKIVKILLSHEAPESARETVQTKLIIRDSTKAVH
ncbi:MAG: GntR family transcriptional regulator [Spirochaetota bacterium]